jgi:hypothetical protein
MLNKACLLTALLAATVTVADPAFASERERRFFKSVEGEWTGAGEIVAGKYKGTKFVCSFKGAAPEDKIGMELDGGCRVGVFTQKMSASFAKSGRDYAGTFMDGAAGKGLDITGAHVDGRKVTVALHRNQLKGAMLARLPDDNTMNVTVSVRVEEKLVPVIGISLKRVDATSVGALATE